MDGQSDNFLLYLLILFMKYIYHQNLFLILEGVLLLKSFKKKGADEQHEWIIIFPSIWEIKKNICITYLEFSIVQRSLLSMIPN